MTRGDLLMLCLNGMLRRYLGAIAIAMTSLACAPFPDLTLRQREAEAIGRVVDRERRETFVLTRHSARSPLYGDGVSAANWTTSSGTFFIECVEGTRSGARTSPAHCEPRPSTAETKQPSPRASELVAIAEQMAVLLPCSDGDQTIERRLDAAGQPAYVVRACGRSLAFYVDCRTDDPASAPRSCRAAITSVPIEIDENAHPGLHVRTCGDTGWGQTMLDPEGAADGLSTEAFRDFALRLANASAEVKSVGYGPCLCPEGSTTWCARVYLDSKADLNAAADLVASALLAPGSKIRVLVGVQAEKAHQ